jgi:hypothetical protein
LVAGKGTLRNSQVCKETLDIVSLELMLINPFLASKKNTFQPPTCMPNYVGVEHTDHEEQLLFLEQTDIQYRIGIKIQP